MSAGAEEPRPTIDQSGELRSAAIEGLRALAAIGVLVFHIYIGSTAAGVGAGDTVSTVDKLVTSGRFAVFLFFALTGYLLFRAFAIAHFRGGSTVDLRRYARNRVLRILPLYYAVVIVVLVFQEHGATAGVWLRFLTFTENYSTLTAGKFVSPIWSLGVEVLFYLLLPLIAVGVGWLAQRSPRRALAVLGTLGVAAIAFRYATVIRPDEQNLWQYSLPSTFWFFVPGMALAVLAVEWERARPAWAGGWLGSSSVWFAAAVTLWIVVALKPDADALIGVASFLLIGPFALGLRPGPFSAAPAWRPLAALGIASYSLYLWHVPLLRAIENVNNGELPFGTLSAIAVPLAIVIALLSYAVIESPFLGMRRRWAETSPAPAEPGPGA